MQINRMKRFCDIDKKYTMYQREYDISPYASSPYVDLPQTVCQSQFAISANSPYDVS